MSILNLLASDNFITVNRQIAGIVGLEAAVILGELVSEFLYWQSRDGLQDGFFFSTVENLEKKTFLSAHSQRQAIDKLKDQGFVDVEKKGMPAKRYIRINEQAIESALMVDNKSLKILTTSDENFAPQEVKNFNCNNNIDNKTIEKDNKGKNKLLSTNYDEILSQAAVIRDNPQLQEAFIGFIEMRKKLKCPPTDRALKMIINEAYKLGGGQPDKMTDIVNQSTLNGWKDVYPLKDKSRPGQTHDDNPFTSLLIEEGYQ